MPAAPYPCCMSLPDSFLTPQTSPSLGLQGRPASGSNTAPLAATLRQPNRILLGLALLGLATGFLYLQSSVDLRQALLWVVGALLGITLYQSSFGFTHAWRVFSSDRQAAGIRAQMLMLGVGVLLFFPFLYQGELWGTAVQGLRAPLNLAVVIGAFMFGIGMQLGGGCASGTLYTAGGGNARMLVTLLCFIIGAVLATLNFDQWMALPGLPPVVLFESWGLGAALAVQLLAFAAIALIATWMERRRHGRLVSSALRTRRPASLLSGPWPLVWGGIALVVLNFSTLWLSGRPWGITSAFALWGARTLTAAGVPVDHWDYWLMRLDILEAPLAQDVTTVMNIGLMLGALAAAAWMGSFAPSLRIPVRSLLAAVLGGLLLGYGSRLSFGCNIGAYFSGMLSGSLHAWLWLPAAFLGSALGVKLRPLFGLAVEKLPPRAAC